MKASRLATIFLILASFAWAQRQVSYTTLDGIQLHADLYGQGPRGLVLVHGGRSNKESWAKQALLLANAGFQVLAIDFRGYGQTKIGPHGELGSDEGRYLDVLAAVRYLRERGAHAVSVIGASMGGDASAEAVAHAKPGEIDNLVLLGSSGNDQMQNLKTRKLFIVSRGDTSADGPRLPKIRRQFDQTPEPKELVVLDGSAHAQFIFGTDQADRLMREILHFLSVTEPHK